MIFLDTNVLLDSALARGENGNAASSILSLCEYGKIKCAVSFLSVANMAYTIKKGRTTQDVKTILKEYTRYLSVLSMDNTQLQAAYDVAAPDFEDVLQYECAKSAGCNLIVTNNTKHFNFIEDIEVVTTLNFASQFTEEIND